MQGDNGDDVAAKNDEEHEGKQREIAPVGNSPGSGNGGGGGAGSDRGVRLLLARPSTCSTATTATTGTTATTNSTGSPVASPTGSAKKVRSYEGAQWHLISPSIAEFIGRSGS